MEVPPFGEHPVETGVNDGSREPILDRPRQHKAYGPLVASAFPGQADPVSWSNVIHAIASFQRGLIPANSRYDPYPRGSASLAQRERRGLALLIGEMAECFHCHGSSDFNDQVTDVGTGVVETPFHDTGLFNMGGNGDFRFPNRGLFESTLRPTDMGRFRAPSLRNVAVTGPHMHDGPMRTLGEVLDFYAAGGRVIATGPYAGDGRRNPYKDDLIVNMALSDQDKQDKQDIIAFLLTLTDTEFLTNPGFSSPFP